MGAYAITFLNQKGGVGKTTLVANVAAALARAKQRVLVIDLDKQANVSDRLIGKFKRDRPHVYDLLLDEEGAVDAQQALYRARAPFETVRVIAGDARLAKADRDLSPADRPDVWQALDRKIQPLLESFDFVLIDNPPSINVLTATGLVLVSRNGGYAIPLDLGPDSAKGARAVQAAVERLHVTKVLTTQPDFLGVIFSAYQKGTAKGTKGAVSLAEEAFGGKLAPLKIPHSSYVIEAANTGRVIIETHPQSAAAQAYIALAEALTGEDLTVSKPAAVGRASATSGKEKTKPARKRASVSSRSGVGRKEVLA